MASNIEGREKAARSARPAYLKSLKTVKDSDYWFMTVFQLLDVCKYCVALFTDIGTHLYDFTKGDGDFLEGGLTIGLHLISCILCFFVADYSFTRHPFWNSVLLLLGIHDVDWKLQKRAKDRKNRKLINQFLTQTVPESRYSEEWPNHVEAIAAVNLHRDNMADVNSKFIHIILCSLPMACLKIYFGFIVVSALESSCSLTIITRLPLILFGLWGVILMAIKYDIISLRYLSALSWKYFKDSEYTSKLDVAEFNVASKLSTICFHTTFILYRVQMIMFTFSLDVVIGLSHLVYLIVISCLHHICCRPFYENPPVGIPTFKSSLIEIWTKVFTIRHIHLRKEWIYCQVHPADSSCRDGLIYFTIIWIQHLGGVLCQVLYNIYFAPHGSEIYPRFPFVHLEGFHYSICEDRFYSSLISAQVEKLRMDQYPAYSKFSFGFFCDNIQFYLFIAVNVILFIHFIVTNVTHTKFPAQTAMIIWSKIFMNPRNEKYCVQVQNGPQYLDPHFWLKKFLVLSILSPRDFRKLMKEKIKKRSTRWNEIFAKESESYRKQDMSTVIRTILRAQESNKIPREIKLQLSKLLDFSIRNSDSAYLVALAHIFCLNFSDRMGEMTSIRIAQTCSMLRVSSVVPLTQNN